MEECTELCRPQIIADFADRVYPLPGNSYRYQNTRVTKFDCWKLLKTKEPGKRVKFEAIRKLLKLDRRMDERALAMLGMTYPYRIVQLLRIRKAETCRTI